MSRASRARKLERRTRRAEKKARKRARKEARRLERRTLKAEHRARKEARRLERTRRAYDPYASVAPFAPSVAPSQWRSGLNLRTQPGQTFPEWDKIVAKAIDSLGSVPVSNADVSRTLDSNIRVVLEIDGERATPETLNVVDTKSDGSCLVHAFLTSCSALYRAIPYSHKGRVGQEVRRQLGLPAFEDGSNYLSDKYMFALTQVARNRVLYIALLAGELQHKSVIGETGPYIIIANENGVHYTAITFKGKYVVQRVFI